MTLFIIMAIAFAICLILTIAMVTRSEMYISAQTIIAMPLDSVYQYTSLLGHQEQYNAWLLGDPNINMIYSGVDGTVGFIAAWQSSTRMGNGEQEITKVYEGEGFDSDLRFANHDNVTHTGIRLAAMPDNKTQVIYTMRATPAFPMNLLMPLIKGMLKKNMVTTLANLKRILEK